MSYDALLFDFDGVLADTEPLHFAAWRDTLAPLGFSVEWDFYVANCVGVADDALFPNVFAVDDPASLVARKRAAFRAALEESPPVPPATASFIRGLGAHYALAVVSSSALLEVEPPLIRAGIRDCFELLITREDVERIKPSPEPYLKAALLLRAGAPLVIEDSPAGIAAGRAAGFPVVEVSSPAAMPAEVRAHLAAAIAPSRKGGD